MGNNNQPMQPNPNQPEPGVPAGDPKPDNFTSKSMKDSGCGCA